MTIIQGKTGDWELVIGLEVHAQVTAVSKLFSGAATEFGAEPNTQVSFVDAAMPGMLPVINSHCIEQAVRTGLGINAIINLVSVFDRKNYFYPDLPQGYQISQFKDPIVGRGELVIPTEGGGRKTIGVTRIHLEQDAGKSMHEHSPDHTLIDLNRAGVALMEIVSEPDMRSSAEAAAYVKKLRTILRYLGSCDADMEKGNLRCDANVSVRRVGANEYGTRCEIKNLNSIRYIIQAIDYEAQRQVDVLEEGGEIRQETRLYDVAEGVTRTMRTKEDAHDYRYFPDPDLPPLVLTADYVETIRQNLPELPDAKKQRYCAELHLTEYDAAVLTEDKDSADYFEQVAARVTPKLAANWISSELFGRLHKGGIALEASPISPEHLADLIVMIEDGTLSGKMAKQVFEQMFISREAPKVIVAREGLQQMTDTGAIETIVDQVIVENADKVAEYRAGKDRLLGFFVGQVMKLSGGAANPETVNELLKKKLAS